VLRYQLRNHLTKKVTILSPTIGKAVKKLVITVAAQKLIWPQTKT
jgi:hypothetical protein